MTIDAKRLSIVTRALLVAWCAVMTLFCFTLFTWIVHDRRMPGWPDVLDRVEHGPLINVAHGGVALAVVADAVLFALFGLVHPRARRGAPYICGSAGDGRSSRDKRCAPCSSRSRQRHGWR